MNEVEKMYENANIKKKKTHFQGFEDWFWEYPPFTAEKQLAILQLLTQRCDLTVSHFTEWEFIHFDGQEPLQITGKDFTETFAKLINAYWQDLTEEERKRIKNILESEVRE